MSTLKRIVQNITYLTSAEVIWRALSFVATIYLIRVLPVGTFGQISFAQTVVVIYFVIITDFGLVTLGIRNTARERERINYFITNILSIRVILAAVSFGLLCLFVFLINKPASTKSLLILYGLSIFPTVLLVEWVFRGLEKMQYVGIGRVLNKVFYLALILLFVKGQEQILLVPVFWFVGSCVAMVYCLYVYCRQNKISFQIRPKEWCPMFIEALPMGFSFLMLTIFHSFDTVMLGFMKTDTHVGWYSAPDRIILVLVSFTAILSRVIFPVCARYYKHSKEKLEELLRRTFKYVAVLAVPMGFGGVILAPAIIRLFFRERYLHSAIVFQILIWTVVACFLRIVFTQSALACERQKTYLKGVIIGVIVNIILNFILIPRFDIRGAAVATVISDVVLLVYMIKRFDFFSKSFIATSLAKPLFASVIMALAVWYVRSFNLFVAMAIGLAVYALALGAMRHISRQELAFLKSRLFS